MSDFIRCSVCGRKMSAHDCANLAKPVCPTCVLRSESTLISDAQAEEPDIPTCFHTQEQAGKAINELSVKLPFRLSAYVASGKVGAVGTLLAIASSAISVVACAAAALLLVAIGTSLAVSLVPTLRGIDSDNVSVGGKIVATAVYFITLCSTYVAAGIVSAFIAKAAVRIGKIRNSTVAYCMALFPALLGAGIVDGLICLGRLQVYTGTAITWCANIFLGWLVWGAIFMVVGLYIAVAIAVGIVSATEDSGKFCEECRKNMAKIRLPVITIPSAMKIIEKMRQGDVAGAAVILKNSQTTRKPDHGVAECRPVVYRCPVCNKGYLEIDAIYNVIFGSGPNSDTYKLKRMVGSWKLDPKDTEAIIGRLPEASQSETHGSDLT